MKDLGNSTDCLELESATQRVAHNLTCIRENKIHMAADWAWADLPYSVRDLYNLLNEFQIIGVDKPS